MPDLQQIIDRLTLEEKAALCVGASAWTTAPVERQGVPALLMADGPHGVRRVPDVTSIAGRSLPATCFPTAACQAATWNVDLVGELGAALGDECLARGVQVLLGPGNNMKRTPLCGRNFEYYSEDPHLSGALTARYIKSLQSKGVGASLKHYAANNQEFQRFSIDAQVDPRALREIYLPAFETAVKQAQPWMVMCAYNKVNGVYASEHAELLTRILKDQWGFEGLVVSDWGAVHDRVAALKAGLDLEMPGPKARRVQSVIDSVRDGTLDMSALDAGVRRVLRIVFMGSAGASAAREAETAADTDAHHALARRIAGEGIVLLKNDGVLPLGKPGRIAVIGRAAREPHFQGGGSSFINPTRVDVPLDAIRARAAGASVTYAAGYPADLSLEPALIAEAAAHAAEAEIALVFVALPGSIESEGYDRPNLDLTPQQVALIKAVTAAQPRTVVVINSSSAMAMREWIDGAAAVLEAWLMGQAGGAALADIFFGDVNPSGKLAETFPLALSDTPAHLNYPGENGAVRYGEGLYIGYRYYDAAARPVLFPFGFGLSYTTFGYSNARVSAATFKDTESITVSIDITNTGAVAGKEVVQLYVHDKVSRLARPPKELKAFAKVDLRPGETRTVTMPLDFRSFAYYDPAHSQWVAESGEFELRIGASSADIRCALTVTLQSTQALPSLLNRASTVREWLADPRGSEVFRPIYRRMQAEMSRAMGADQDEGIGMDMSGFILDLPLLSVFHFQEGGLPVSPEEMVDALISTLA